MVIAVNGVATITLLDAAAMLFGPLARRVGVSVICLVVMIVTAAVASLVARGSRGRGGGCSGDRA
jgi:hypothetical protein